MKQNYNGFAETELSSLYLWVLVHKHVYLTYGINISIDNYSLVKIDCYKNEFQKDFTF